jgi:hypothetical protein
MDVNEHQMKKKYHNVRIIPKSNIKIVERVKIDTPNIYIHVHDRSLCHLIQPLQ